MACNSFPWALLAHLGQRKVPAVAFQLVCRQLEVFGECETAVFPAVESFGHGIDFGVSHLFEGLRRQKGTDSARAIDDDRPILVRQGAFHLNLEESARDGNSPLDITLPDFILFPDIEQNGPVSVSLPVVYIFRRQLGNRLPRLRHQFVVRLDHDFRPSVNNREKKRPL